MAGSGRLFNHLIRTPCNKEETGTHLLCNLPLGLGQISPADDVRERHIPHQQLRRFGHACVEVRDETERFPALLRAGKQCDLAVYVMPKQHWLNTTTR